MFVFVDYQNAQNTKIRTWQVQFDESTKLRKHHHLTVNSYTKPPFSSFHELAVTSYTLNMPSESRTYICSIYYVYRLCSVDNDSRALVAIKPLVVIDDVVVI